MIIQKTWNKKFERYRIVSVSDLKAKLLLQKANKAKQW